MAIINGTSGDDWFGNALEGLPENDSYFGFAGTDWLIASLGDDILNGGTGEDLGLYGQGQFTSGVFINNTLEAIDGVAAQTVDKRGFGIDTLVDMENFHGTNFDDVIYLGNHEDGTYSLDLGGDDLVVAYQGADVSDSHNFGAGSGNDTYLGTINRDVVDYNREDGGGDAGGNITQGVNVDLEDETATDGWGDTDTLISVERVIGTRFDDVIRGDDARNDFWGLEGNDILDGRGGDRDRAIYSDDPTGVIVDLAAGTATDGWGDTDTLIDIERLRGSEFADVLRGNDADNVLSGQGGNDTLEGGAGDDDLEGGQGADTLDGGEGFDVVTFGDADDGGTNPVFVDLAAGTATDTFGDTDTLISIEGADGSEQGDVLSGDDNDNFLSGREGDDTLTGLGGRDSFRGGEGDDTIDGGAGDDRVDYTRDAEDGGTAGVTVDLEAGAATDGFGDTDTLISIEDVRGTDSADTITGNDADNHIEGRGDDDTLTGGGGDDDLSGGAGDDMIYGGDGRDYLQPGAGTDFIDGGSEPGENDGDMIVYRHDEGITTGVTITWATDDDGTAIDWTGATDTFVDIERARGTDFADTMTGAEGRQQLQGEGGNDTLFGGAGGDDLSGGDGDDTLDGGVGGDFLQPGAGNDTVIGGANGPEFQTDTIAYIFDDNVGSGVVVTYSTETDGSITDYSGGTDTFTGVEEVSGTNFSDTFNGAEGRQRFTGFGGNDTFIGGAGDEDRVSYEREQSDVGASQGIVVELGAGTATDAYGDTDTLIGIEEIRGTDWDDTITGDGNRNNLQGEDGADVIDSAGGENNYLEGGIGNDILFARGRNDYVDAGDGDDTITFFEEGGTVDPGLGSDTINGLAGGFSQLEYRSLTGSVTIDKLLGTTVKSDGGTDSFTNIETISGGRGDDTLLGSDQEDYEAYDTSRGDDFIDGRDGFDEIRYFNDEETSVTINFITGTASGTYSGTDTFVNIESAQGSLGDDTFIGGDQAFTAYRGIAGNDTFTGGTGIDEISYSADRFFDGGANGVTVNLATGTATDGFGDTDTFTSIERVRATNFADTLTGDDGDNRLADLAGDDVVNAGAGDDVLRVGLGSDTLSGGTGADYFVGTTAELDGDTITDFALEDTFYIMDPAFNLIGADITSDADNIFIDIDGDGVAEATLVNGSGYTGPINSEGGPATGEVAAVVTVENAGFFTASVVEGDAGTTPVEITLTRSGDLFAEVSVDFEIAGFGANPVDGNDVDAGLGAGSVTFAPGQTEAVVTVAINGDTTIETSEDLRVTLTAAASDGVLPAEIAGAETYIRILNDDVPPQVNVTGDRTTEDSGIPLRFTFARDGDTAGDLTVTYRLRGGPDELDADPDDLSGGLPQYGSITIADGTTEAVLDLPVVADGVTEPHETVYAEIISLSGAGAAGYQIGVGEASASIRNDDGLPPEFPTGLGASNFGDPHLITLDGLAYDFQAVGEFTLIEAVSGDPLNVQVRYRPVEGSDIATRTTAMAVDVDGLQVVFDLDAPSLIRIDGAGLDLAAGSFTEIGGAGGALYFDGEVYSLVLSSGDQIRVTDRGSFLDLNLGLQPDRDVRGLLGNGDGNTANDLALRDGTVLSQPVSFDDLYGVFADSWRIDDVSSLFDYEAGQGTADFTDLSFPAGVVSLDDIPTAIRAAAEEAAAGIDDPVLRDAAILDYILSGDDSYIDAAAAVGRNVEAEAEPVNAPIVGAAIGVSASNLRITEGDEGSQTVLFTVYRTGDLGDALDVAYGFEGNADDADVSGLEDGTLSFAEGQAEASVSVAVLGDMQAEGDEEFIFRLDPGDNGPLVLSGQATVVIEEDDSTLEIIEGTERSDFLFGGDGDQVIRPFGGAINLVVGGEGSDLFVFGDRDDNGRRDRLLITDYEAGIDALSLGDAEIVGIRERGSHVMLTLEGDRADRIFVFGVDSFDDLTIL